MTVGNESPEEKMFGVIVPVAEPMTSAAAIVSPMARPRPSITAPTMPPTECGSTAPVIISHRVAPSARAPSRSVCGVVSITSRDTDDTIGVIMTARISAGGEEGAAAGHRAEDPPQYRPVAEPPVDRGVALLQPGASTRMPHRPKTTDGTTASRSVSSRAGGAATAARPG